MNAAVFWNAWSLGKSLSGRTLVFELTPAAPTRAFHDASRRFKALYFPISFNALPRKIVSPPCKRHDWHECKEGVSLPGKVGEESGKELPCELAEHIYQLSNSATPAFRPLGYRWCFIEASCSAFLQPTQDRGRTSSSSLRANFSRCAWHRSASIWSGFHRLSETTDFPVVGAHSVPVICPSVADFPQGERMIFPCAYGNVRPLSRLSRAFQNLIRLYHISAGSRTVLSL